MVSKRKRIKKVNEVVNTYCPAGKWCLLKEIMISKHTDPRFLVQFKCIEHLKYEESQSVGYDIQWNKAHEIWIGRGYAELFSQYYNEDLTAEQIYEKILDHQPCT